VKPQPTRRSVDPGTAAAGGVVAVALGFVAMLWSMENASYDIWAGFWIAPVLMMLIAPVTRRAGERENSPALGRFLFWAAFLKIVVGSSARAMMVYWLYDGDGDAERYFTVGATFAKEFRRFDFTRVGRISGTDSVEYFTGGVIALIGESRLGGFMVFSFLGFIGVYYFYRAFRISLPQSDERRYRLLLFLAPTMWFWPSSIGKDSLMVFALGVATYGGARILRGEWAGLVPVFLGGALVVIVRPHLALIWTVGFGAALIVRSVRSYDSGHGSTGKRGQVAFIALPLMMVALAVIIPRFEQFFEIDQLSGDTAGELFTEVDRRTSKGGSELNMPDPQNPVGFVAVVGTIMFRPLPFEARNPAALVASLENVFYLWVFFRWRRSVWNAVRQVFRTSWVAFAIAYSMVFCFAFASIENFAILARQRAQLFPVVFVLVCVGEARRTGRFGPVAPVKAEPVSTEN
jgi:hypothetical protein